MVTNRETKFQFIQYHSYKYRFRYRYRFRNGASFGIGIGGHFADTEIAEILVSAQIQVSVVNFSSIMG
jgi:hypothetical protein